MSMNVELMMFMTATLGAGGGYLLARRDLLAAQATVDALRVDLDQMSARARRMEADLTHLRGMVTELRDRPPTGNTAVLHRVQEILFAPSHRSEEA